MKLLMNDPGDV